jgi:hypothetical protein
VLPAYFDLVDTLAASAAHLHACVVDREVFDPSAGFRSTWEPHAQVAAQLLRGSINRRELVSVLMDSISTPVDVAFEDYVRDRVNTDFKCMSVVSAVALNSKSCDGLQAVDVFAGALAWQRRCEAEGKRPKNEKSRVVDRVMERFNVDFRDGRTLRTNILTLKGLPVSRGRGLIALPETTGT